jgi:hypothetical protein
MKAELPGIPSDPNEKDLEAAADAYAQTEALRGRMHTKLYRAAFIAGARYAAGHKTLDPGGDQK